MRLEASAKNSSEKAITREVRAAEARSTIIVRTCWFQIQERIKLPMYCEPKVLSINPAGTLSLGACSDGSTSSGDRLCISIAPE